MLAFVDRDKSSNMDRGLEYYAVGVVDERYDTNSLSGKDLAVSFVDPWGYAHHEWRGDGEVELTEIDDEDWKLMNDAIERAVRFEDSQRRKFTWK